MSGNLYPDQYWESYKEVCEDDKGYPQPTVWGNLPSSGLFIRHVQDIEIDNVTFKSTDCDPRIPIIAVNVGTLSINDANIISITGTDVLMHNIKKHNLDKRLRVKED